MDIMIAAAAALPACLINEQGSISKAAQYLMTSSSFGKRLARKLSIDTTPWQGTPTLTRSPNMRSAVRFFSIGDAAGFAEPFTGEGMAWALESADLLAQVCAAITPGAWNAATATHYEKLWRRRIARRQRICKALSFAIARPAAVTALARIATIARPLPQALSQRVAQA